MRLLTPAERERLDVECRLAEVSAELGTQELDVRGAADGA
jgi:hypothetical protein